MCPWPETCTPSCCCRRPTNPLVSAEDPSEEELSSLNKKLPPPYCIQRILKQIENVTQVLKIETSETIRQLLPYCNINSLKQMWQNRKQKNDLKLRVKNLTLNILARRLHSFPLLRKADGVLWSLVHNLLDTSMRRDSVSSQIQSQNILEMSRPVMGSSGPKDPLPVLLRNIVSKCQWHRPKFLKQMLYM